MKKLRSERRRRLVRCRAGWELAGWSAKAAARQPLELTSSATLQRLRLELGMFALPLLLMMMMGMLLAVPLW